MELIKKVDEENLHNDRNKLRNWQREIQMVDNENLDDKFIEFIDKNDLESNDDIVYWLRKFKEFLKSK